jgi:hypothetical protein
MNRAFPVLLCLLSAYSLPAHAKPSCKELNRLYLQKYIDDFSIDRQLYEVSKNTRFRCDGFDKNYILARAINDLDTLRPVKADVPDYYDAVSQVLNLEGTALRYIPNLAQFPNASAKVYNDGNLAVIFVTDSLIRSKRRFRMTYTLVHEVRHTLKKKPGVTDEPDHIMCTRGKFRGVRACDKSLSKESKLAWGSGNSHEFLYLLTVRNHPRASAKIKREIESQLSYLATHMFNKLEPGILDYYDVRLLR